MLRWTIVLCYYVSPHHKGDTIRTLTDFAPLTGVSLGFTASTMTAGSPLLSPLHGREVSAALLICLA